MRPDGDSPRSGSPEAARAEGLGSGGSGRCPSPSPSSPARGADPLDRASAGRSLAATAACRKSARCPSAGSRVDAPGWGPRAAQPAQAAASPSPKDAATHGAARIARRQTRSAKLRAAIGRRGRPVPSGGRSSFVTAAIRACSMRRPDSSSGARCPMSENKPRKLSSCSHRARQRGHSSR